MKLCEQRLFSGVLVCVFAFACTARAQDDTYQSLLTEARALSSITDLSQFLIMAGDIKQRAQATLAADELRTVQDRVGDDAARRLLEPGAVSRLDAATVRNLSELALGVLTEAQRASLRAAARRALGDFSDVSYVSLKEHIDVRTKNLYADSEEGRVARRKLIVAWAASRDPEALPIDQVDWVMMQMLPKWMSENVPQEIDATWTARINAPTTGEYTFGLSPLNLIATRDEGESKYFKLWMTVVVDGQTVLEATPDSWKTKGAAVSLTAGQAKPVSVTLKYRMKGYMPLPASGQLYWSGPGISKQVVGASFYQLPDANQPGVRLSVTRKDKFGVHPCTTTVVAIDQVLGKHPICEHERLLGEYIRRRLDDFLSTSFLNQALANATIANEASREPHPFTKEPDYRGIVNKCSSAQRKRIAQELALVPQIFSPLDVWTMVYFHDAVRFGAEREALDMLAGWLTVHTNDSPELVGSTREYFQANLAPCRHLIIPLQIEHAESGRWLEDDYLATVDGDCNLAVAKVVGYIHLVSGRTLEWINKLDAKLDETTAVGDRRVGWLIARAMAEEIRRCPQDPKYFPGSHRFGAGMGWLDEAMLVAKTPAVKERVVRQRVARLAALGKFDEAKEALEGYPSLASLDSQLDALKQASSDKVAAEAVARDAAVLAEMKRRQKRAAGRGDTDAASRYASIIEQLQNQ